MSLLLSAHAPSLSDGMLLPAHIALKTPAHDRTAFIALVALIGWVGSGNQPAWPASLLATRTASGVRRWPLLVVWGPLGYHGAEGATESGHVCRFLCASAFLSSGPQLSTRDGSGQ